MLVSRSLSMIAAADAGYPTYSIRAAGGSWSSPTNTGVARVGSTTSYSVDLDLASGRYSINWDPGGGRTYIDDFEVAAEDYAAASVGANLLGLAATDPRRLTSQVGKRALITGGTAGVGQVGVITASNTSTFVQTIADGWDASVTPTGSPVTYDILPAASAGSDIDPDAVASAVADTLGDAAVVGTVAGSPTPTALSFTLTGLPTGVPAAAYVGRKLFAQDAAALAGFGFAIATATSSVAGTVAVTIASGSVAPTSAPSAGTIYHIYP